MGIRTKMYQKQHAEIKRVMDQIMASLDSSTLKKNTDDVRSLVNRLVGKLSVHLALEDNVLYPYLADSSNIELKEMGRSLQAQVGGLRKALKSYKESWTTPMSIEENPAQFAKDSKEFIDVIKNRIQLEDDGLFAAIS